MAAFALYLSVSAQVDWNTNGNGISGTEWFGADGTSTIPLSFETRVNQPMLWSTNSVNRMRLMGTNTTGTINGYTGLNLSGFLGLGPFGSTLVNQPFAAIHIDNNGIQESAYRPWMRTGMLLTQGSDQGYFGLKDEGVGRNHSVIAWSDNTLNDPGPDNLRFIFTSNNTTAYGTAGQLDGLEAARFVPAATGNQTFFGIGDWFTAGIIPRERVDMLDGRLRIRQLPDDAAANGAFRVMVVDDTPAPSAERGVVKWADLSALVDCDWVVQSPIPHVSNTYDGSNCTWDRRHGVGIGAQYPKYKLHVTHTSDALLSPTAIFGEALFNVPQSSGLLHGVIGRAGSIVPNTELQQQRAFGVKGEAFGSRASIGVFGYADITQAQGGNTATQTYGVMGQAFANENSDHVVGVFGSASGATDPMDNWAGWFEGNVNIQGGDLYLNEMYAISDSSLKTSVQDVQPSADLLGQLQVRSYQFNADVVSQMHLPEGPRVGLIAQEVEGAFPQLVSDVHVPARYDTTGAVIGQAYDYKAVNYVGFIPYLISAIQRLSADNVELREQMAACCAAAPTDGDQRMQMENGGLLFGHDRALVIQPNPFSEPPTVLYTLERAGRMQLIANSADGKQLSVLHEAAQDAGDYQLVWDTSALQPGMYYLTLLLDGEPVVKKAVKVGR